MAESIIRKFPRQKLPLKQKTKDWRKKHINWADTHSRIYNNKVRQSYRNKVINYNLYAGIADKGDMKAMLNPFDKRNYYIPDSIQHYPIVNNAIDLLVGEESNRKTKLTARVANQDAISDLEERRTEAVRAEILKYIQEDGSQEELQQKASRLQNYLNYNIQDLEELNDNFTLTHYMKEVSFDSKLREGFKDVVITNEEVYYFDIVAGNPIMEKLNPKKVFTYRTGNSSRMEDADIIILDDYWSPGKILDTYYDKLTAKDQKLLEEASNYEYNDHATTYDEREGYIYVDDMLDDLEGLITTGETVDGVLAFAYSNGLADQRYIDRDGNLRVLRILWKSKRKVQKVKSYDPETGEPIYSYKAETYKIKEELGEESEVQWWNEWWEGTKIGQNIYVNMRPKEVQFRDMNNKSICYSGIVGQCYNSGQTKGFSPMDKMKPYQYLYNSVHDRLIKILTNHIGSVLEVDTAKIPAGWKPDKWLHFLRTENIAFVDSFKEGNKGSATGKLAGNFNTTGKSLSLDLGNSIQLYIDLLEYLKRTMYEVVGLTPQRLGEIKTSETVGGVERSVNQSSNITAELFAIHDDVKKRCATTLLEVAKQSMRGENKKTIYVTDNNINRIININTDRFSSRQHGIFIENELDLGGLRQELKQLAHAWSQNETVTPSTILQILNDPSLTSIQRKIEMDIQNKQERDQQTIERQQKSQEEMAKQQQEIQQRAQQIEDLRLKLDERKLDLDKYEIDIERQTKLDIADKQYSGEDNTIENEKLDLQEEKVDKEFDFKNKQLQETKRHNKETESIQRNKPNKTSK